MQKRLKSMQCPCKRAKLDFGDYSIETILTDGETLNLTNHVAVERKMNLDEICQNFTRGRGRFVSEFERAKETNAKIYLLIENGNWEKVLNGNYRTKVNPKALIASLTAWLARYNCQIIFCEENTSGILIKEILFRELKEFLERRAELE